MRANYIRKAETFNLNNIMKLLREYPKKVLLGKVDNENIFLSTPSWDCGWYWGFGYLGNKNCHYHVDGLKKIETYNSEKSTREYEFVDLKTGFERHFGESFIIRPSDRWVFAELFSTFYKLKEAAEVLGRGGSHLTLNPAKDIIINKDETDRINNIVLPAIFDEIYKVIERNQENPTHKKKLLKHVQDGESTKVVDYMFEHKFNTDDLKEMTGILKNEYSTIHGMYWKRVHNK